MESSRARPRSAEPRPGDERAGSVQREGQRTPAGQSTRASAAAGESGARVRSARGNGAGARSEEGVDARRARGPEAEAPGPAGATALDAASPVEAECHLELGRGVCDLEPPPPVRGEPPPLHGGPLTLLRFMRAHRMLNHRYARLIVRLLVLKLRFRGRLQTDGLAFVGPGVTFEIGRHARVVLGRWSWLGHGTKIRAHEGEVIIGAKSVLGQECTISAFQHVSIGRECVIADRVMMIDFDHGVVEVERPIRLQGIYKRDVRVGNNVWIGYGACILRGVSIGDNAILGTSAVVTRDVPDDAVVAGIPARVIRMRPKPRRLRWR